MISGAFCCNLSWGGTERLERLVLDLFDLDRVSRGITEPQREPVELHALIRRVVAHLDLADHTVEDDLQPTTAAVDAAMIERVVENLVVNAAKHTPAGTPVVVRLHSEGGRAVAAHPALRELRSNS